MVNMTTSKETNNEVARLREEIDRLKRGCQGSCYACEPVGEMNLKLEAEVARFCRLLENMTESRDTMIEDRNVLDNEVARLRELLNRAIEIARTLRKLAFINSEDYCDWHFEDRLKAANDFADLCKEVNQLAPASEETQDGATMDEWYGGFGKIESTEPVTKRVCKNCGQPHSKHTLHPYETICPEPAPAWRELGYDEVIGAYDEYNPTSLGEWIKVPHGWIGEKCDITKIRTRRPLCPNNAPKQEEMPLKDDHQWFRISMCINEMSVEIQEIRDEIQKLKAETHYHHESYCRKCKEPK